jgi:hypothetical protein
VRRIAQRARHHDPSGLTLRLDPREVRLSVGRPALEDVLDVFVQEDVM